MLKWIGLFCVVLCGAGAGWLSAMRLQQEKTAAERLCRFLRELAVQMEFRACTVQELLEALRTESAYQQFRFLNDVLLGLEAEKSLCNAWQDAIRADAAVPPAVKEILLPLGNELGVSDLSGQMETLAQYRRQLEDCFHEIAQRNAKRQRLFLSMGLLGGMMAAILLC